MIRFRLTTGLFIFIPAVFGQSSATLTGTVLTASERSPIPKASIRATNTSSGATFSAQSAADGRYAFPALPPGAYQITAECPPFFLPFKREGLQLEAGRTTQLDVPLDDGQLNTLGDGGSYFVLLNSDHPVPKGRTPLTRGKPDLSGVWLPAPLLPVGSKPEPLPWAEELGKNGATDTAKIQQRTACPED